SRSGARQPESAAGARQQEWAGSGAGAIPSKGNDAAGASGSATLPPEPTKDAAFLRLTLFESDDAGWVFQEDGQVLRMSAGRLRYLRTLTPPQIDTLRQALAAAHASSWSGGGAGARLLLESGALRRVTGLPSSDPAVDALARTLASLGRGETPRNPA